MAPTNALWTRCMVMHAGHVGQRRYGLVAIGGSVGKAAARSPRWW